jgi:hypothetical protein
MNDDMPWVFGLTDEEVQELRIKKQELTQYGKEKIRQLMNHEEMLEEAARREAENKALKSLGIDRETFGQKPWDESMLESTGDSIRNYPEITRVEVITYNGREYVNWDCSDVKVTIQDEGRTLKVFLS